jgi:hypothetical protein
MAPHRQHPPSSDRSGGVDLDADQLKIGGDAVGRGKVVDKSIKVGNIEQVTGLAIGDGASVTVIHPQPVSAPQQDTSKKSGKRCVVILTALPVEYQAVRPHLINLKEEKHPQGTIDERGAFGTDDKTWEVGLSRGSVRATPARRRNRS